MSFTNRDPKLSRGFMIPLSMTRGAKDYEIESGIYDLIDNNTLNCVAVMTSAPEDKIPLFCCRIEESPDMVNWTIILEFEQIIPNIQTVRVKAFTRKHRFLRYVIYSRYEGNLDKYNGTVIVAILN